MIISAMFAFLHFVAVFGIFCTVFLEWQTMTPTPNYVEARRMQRCDLWYGIFAGVVLVVGFMRVYHFEKGHAFYSASPFYYVKLALFLLVGLISIYPTVRFIKWRSYELRSFFVPRVERGFILNDSVKETRNGSSWKAVQG